MAILAFYELPSTKKLKTQENMNAKIVFYAPKSLFSSILGVLVNMALLLMPMLLLAVYQVESESTSWRVVLIGLPIGIFLVFKSEPIVYPLVGIKHEFVFSDEFVEIISAKIKEKIALKDLKITAFEVPADDSSIKHIVLEWSEDKKIDIFETWVTGDTLKGFYLIFGKHFLTDN